MGALISPHLNSMREGECVLKKKEVIILGIGPSRTECPFDAEVWAVVRVLTLDGLKDRQYSKVFAFDSRTIPALKKPIDIALEKHIPLVSTKPYATEKLPIDDMIKKFGATFFKNTISYMIAYAIYLGYEKIRLYGVDQAPEWDYIANKPYVLYWMGVADGIGIAKGRGPQTELAKGSLLSHVLKDDIKRRFKEIKESKDWSQIVWAEKGPVFIKGNNVKVKITGDGYKPQIRKRKRGKRDILSYLILMCLYLIKPFRTIKLCYIRSIAIGQQAGNTGLFLRRLQLNHQKGTSYIGISNKPDNRQLLKMFKRKMPIIQNNLLAKIHREPILARSPFYMDLPLPHNCYDEFRRTKPDLEFTPDEEEQGQALLRRMGIGEEDWFVCFLSRDNAFILKQDPNRQYNSEFRDSNVDNFLEAAKYITDCGGYAIRMGAIVGKELHTNNPRIIDYASNYRTDFGDIYLSAKCKFYLGDTAGLWLVPTLFNVPVAGTNFIPFHTPFRAGDMFIPKKIWAVDHKRYLTLREYISFNDSSQEIGNVRFLNKLLNGNYEVRENTSQEVLDLAKEMNERLDGVFQETEETEKLQQQFRSLLTQSDIYYETPARIGTEFVRQMCQPIRRKTREKIEV